MPPLRAALFTDDEPPPHGASQASALELAEGAGGPRRLFDDDDADDLALLRRAGTGGHSRPQAPDPALAATAAPAVEEPYAAIVCMGADSVSSRPGSQLQGHQPGVGESQSVNEWRRSLAGSLGSQPMAEDQPSQLLHIKSQQCLSQGSSQHGSQPPLAPLRLRPSQEVIQRLQQQLPALQQQLPALQQQEQPGKTPQLLPPVPPMSPAGLTLQSSSKATLPKPWDWSSLPRYALSQDAIFESVGHSTAGAVTAEPPVGVMAAWWEPLRQVALAELMALRQGAPSPLQEAQGEPEEACRHAGA